MASIQQCSSSRVAVARSSIKLAPLKASRRTVTARASAAHAEGVDRRDVLIAAAVTLGVLAPVAPARAFLGFGEGGPNIEEYNSKTTSILAQARAAIELPKDDPSKEDKVKELRTNINLWVAQYRRDQNFSGKPSYGNTYAVLNALAGHYNSFGPTAPIPKKRLERVMKELNDANSFLSRGR